MSTHEKEWNVWIYGLTQEKYWNSEHFDDPTAGKAIARVMAEQRRKEQRRKGQRRKEQRRKELKLAEPRQDKQRMNEPRMAEQRMAEKVSGKAAQEAATESTGKTAKEPCIICLPREPKRLYIIIY